MSLFAIADTHLSFGTDKPMDQFYGWQDYVSRLESNWNRLVSDEDTVVIAGDISWAMNFEELKKDFAYINDTLSGEKIILKGNHDYWWNTKSKMDKFLLENHFDKIKILNNNAEQTGPVVVCGSRGWPFDSEDGHDVKMLGREAGRLRMSLDSGKKLEGERIVFLHYPPVNVNESCDEILGLLREEEISRCYYGHLHGDAARYSVNKTIENIKFSLISADYLGFCPILIEKF